MAPGLTSARLEAVLGGPTAARSDRALEQAES